jgi:glutathione peroxidase-family protein
MFANRFFTGFLCFIWMTSFLVKGDKLDRNIDHHESCEFWASVGECTKNPNYMLSNCAPSCRKAEEEALKKLPESFYDITEKDIHGNELEFNRFKGKVVYVVNVASYCGYTEENYAMFKKLQKYYGDGLEIVLAPCNAFGQQEPGSPVEIHNFAEEKGFSGIILEKGEVNGPGSRLLFKFLKQKGGKQNISW